MYSVSLFPCTPEIKSLYELRGPICGKDRQQFKKIGGHGQELAGLHLKRSGNGQEGEDHH